MLNVHRNCRTLRTLSSITSHLTSTILRCSDIPTDRSIELKLPFISTLCLGPCSEHVKKEFCRIKKCNNFKVQKLPIYEVCTLEKSWRVSFSKFGECSRMQVNGWRSGTHQHSSSNIVFSFLKVGHHLKSLLKINWIRCKRKRWDNPQR